MSDKRRILAVAGEQLAENFFKSAGFQVLARNYRSARGEIDLIVSGHGDLVVCEVKTRSSDLFGHPLEALTAKKRERLRKLGFAYWSTQTDRSLSLRFDVVSVIKGDGGDLVIEHIPNAF